MKSLFTQGTALPLPIYISAHTMQPRCRKAPVTPSKASKKTLDNERINWLQVHGLKDTETIREICSHFEIDFLVLQDILNANHPTKIEEHDKYIVLILKIFYPNEHKEDDDLDGLLQQQVCIILGNNYVLTFLEKETDFFDEINAALRNDILKIRSRLTDYLLSVLLNSIMAKLHFQRYLPSTMHSKTWKKNC